MVQKQTFEKNALKVSFNTPRITHLTNQEVGGGGGRDSFAGCILGECNGCCIL